MNLADLQQATRAHERLREAEDHLNAIAGCTVVGIRLRTGTDLEIFIAYDKTAGTGTISRIGWAVDLEKAMTQALFDVFEARRDEAATDLERLGVKAT
jgi:hypothetical protein